MGDTFTVVVIGVAAVLGGAAFGLAWGLRQGPVEQNPTVDLGSLAGKGGVMRKKRMFWWPFNKCCTYGIALVISAVSLLYSPDAIAAIASHGCTRIGGDFLGDLICFEVRGTGTTIDYGVVSHTTSQDLGATFCNYYGRMTIYDGNGGVIEASNGNYHSGCYGPVYFVTRRIIAFKNFPTARRACGSWFENGSRLGTACLDIHP